MGDVIGYKGTSAERTVNWRTMVLLRAALAYSKGKGRNECADKEYTWYREELSAYRAA